MRLLRAWLILCGLCTGMAHGAEPVPAETQGKLDALVGRLEQAMKPGDYTPKDYFRDLTELGKSVPAELVKPGEHPRGDFPGALLRLASDASRPGAQEKIKELAVWYGQPRHMVPRELRPGMTDEQWKLARSSFAMAQIHDAEPLLKQHSGADYRVAWEAWLISPPSPERGYMEQRATQALGTIDDARSQALYPRMFEWAAARAGDAGQKRAEVSPFLYLIGSDPGAAALDTLLACQRHAVAKEFNGTGIDSVSRQIVRILTSREYRADQMADPAAQESLKAAGEKIVKPEEILPYGKEWQTYFPIIEGRLSNEESPPPAEEAAILQEAMDAMPRAADKLKAKAKAKAKAREKEKLRVEKLKADKEKAEKLKAEKEQAAKEKAEKLKAEKEQAEREKAEKLAAEKEKAEKEKAEKLAAEKEKAEKEKAGEE